MQQSVTLDTISVTAGGSMPFFTTNSAYYTFGIPNLLPGLGYEGVIDTSYGTNSGLSALYSIEENLNSYGIIPSKSLLESFATIDRMAYDSKISAEHAFFNARLLAGQRAFSNNWQSEWLSGSAFSFAKAMVNYMQGDGLNLKVDINTIGLNVRPQDIKALRDVINTAAPGTYNFYNVEFGYQTYKDSVATALYLGGIVLNATGSVTVNSDRSYTYNFDITSAKPDLYDADAKAPGKRDWIYEKLTSFLGTLPGKEFYTEILGSKSFSGQGTPSSLNGIPSATTGNDYDNTIFQFGQNQTLQGGKGNDTYLIYASNTVINEQVDEGADSVFSTLDYALTSNVENLYLSDGAISGAGNELNNILMGNIANNDLRGGGGRDLIDGAEGRDRALYNTYLKDMLIVSHKDRSVLMTQHEGVDHLQNIEIVHGAGYDYYVRDNLLQYVASYADLSSAFGGYADANASLVFENLETYNNYGSRDVTFDGAEYLVSNRDVLNAFGFNPEEAARHYIVSGRSEGRTTNFDSFSYIASYGDLIQAFGTDAVRGSEHFIFSGEREGRSVQFNPYSYMARNPDIGAAFANDPDSAAIHYITAGYAEGRAWA